MPTLMNVYHDVIIIAQISSSYAYFTRLPECDFWFLIDCFKNLKTKTLKPLSGTHKINLKTLNKPLPLNPESTWTWTRNTFAFINLKCLERRRKDWRCCNAMPFQKSKQALFLYMLCSNVRSIINIYVQYRWLPRDREKEHYVWVSSFIFWATYICTYWDFS
mgnify:CR=1 FL=1